MNSLNFIIGLLFGVSIVSAATTRYLAIPIDGIDIIEVNPIAPQRVPRHADTSAYVPMMISHQHQPDTTVEHHQPSSRIERSQPILDYVDFGSQSGTNGAFSWFADYPAHH